MTGRSRDKTRRGIWSDSGPATLRGVTEQFLPLLHMQAYRSSVVSRFAKTIDKCKCHEHSARSRLVCIYNTEFLRRFSSKMEEWLLPESPKDLTNVILEPFARGQIIFSPLTKCRDTILSQMLPHLQTTPKRQTTGRRFTQRIIGESFTAVDGRFLRPSRSDCCYGAFKPSSASILLGSHL